MKPLLGQIYEAQPWTDYIIGYQYEPQYRMYGFSLSIGSLILIRLRRKLPTIRSRAIGLTICNKRIIDYQPDRIKPKNIVKDYLARMSKASKEAFIRLSSK